MPPYLEQAQEDPVNPWTQKDLAVIASTLNGPPSKWRVSDAQAKIPILALKPLPQSDYATRLEQRIQQFRQLITCTNPTGQLRLVPLDDILPITTKMNTMPKWTVANTKFAIPSLSMVAGFMSTGASDEALSEWGKFHSRWLTFLDENPTVMGQVDPWYVTILTPAPAAGYPAIPLPVGHVHPNPVIVPNTNN